jgi:hypothetical protein
MPAAKWMWPLLVCIVAACEGGAQVQKEPARPDFSGIWQVADPELVVRPDVNAKLEDYTTEARANLEAYRKNWVAAMDEPVKYCVRPGMPHTMTSRARDYATEIEQSASRITVLVEYMDSHRVIHLDGAAKPDGVTASNNGYSRGRWDGDSLIIETTALKARHPIGPVQRSVDAAITERWRLLQDPVHGEVLDINMTITDPKVFLQPAKAHQVLKRAAQGTALNEYGCADGLWEDHVDAAQATRNKAKGK